MTLAHDKWVNGDDIAQVVVGSEGQDQINGAEGTR